METVFLSVLAMLIVLLIVILFAKVMTSLETEAKAKGKRIEFVAAVAGMAAVFVALAGLAYSLKQADVLGDKVETLTERVRALENAARQTKSGP